MNVEFVRRLSSKYRANEKEKIKIEIQETFTYKCTDQESYILDAHWHYLKLNCLINDNYQINCRDVGLVFDPKLLLILKL